MFIEDDIDFVKSQIEHHTKSIAYYQRRNEESKAVRHRGILRRFQELLPKIETAVNTPAHILDHTPNVKSEQIGARLGDLSELPDELRSQLVSVQYDELEIQITELIKTGFDGIATIDEILVGLYRQHNDLHQRDQLATKIYRMTKKNLIFAVPSRKGVYSIHPIQDESEEHQS